MPQPLPIWGNAGNGFDTFHPQAAAKKREKLLTKLCILS